MDSKLKVLIDLKRVLGAWPQWIRFFVLPFLDYLLRTNEINSIYSRLTQTEVNPSQQQWQFFRHVLGELSVRYEVEADAFARIPTSGPMLVIANHPYGALDGIILGDLLKGLRPDSLLMANFLLADIKEIRDCIIEVDPFERQTSKTYNSTGIRQSLKHLKNGGCLGVFPAGEVSSFKWRYFHVSDKSWTPHIVQLAMRTNAKIVPVYFEGKNSFIFQLLGLLHPRLRTIMLGRELLNMRGKRIRLRIGKVISPELLKAFEGDEAATDFLRLHTYALSHQDKAWDNIRKLHFPYRFSSIIAQPKAIAPAGNSDELQVEIDQLPTDCLLVEDGDFLVYCAEHKEIPKLIKEIGRLREITFREVGEGTGNSTDLDHFDTYYLHLFLWNKKEKELVGAYRLGFADKIVEKHGVSGLYTRTLFRFKRKLIKKIGPSLELGRSFIQPKYQRKHSTLVLIWRGIGRFVVLHPEYKTLFGPVSISDTYHSISKNLMLHFLREHNFDSELTKLVRPIKSPRTPNHFRGTSMSKIGKSVRSVEAISGVIAGFERYEKGIPVLLKHYLKLNGSLLCFNVDPAFSHVVDGMVIVDLTKTRHKLLARLLSKEGVESFLTFHGIQEDRPE